MRFLVVLVVISLSLKMHSQEDEVQESATSEHLMDDDAYRKMVIEDLNFLVVGDNNPKQGLGYTLNSDKTQLDLTGNFNLGTNNQPLINITASLQTTDGVFILDDKDGAKKGRVTVDLFWTPGWFNSSNYYGGETKKGKNTTLTLLQNASLDVDYLKRNRADSLKVMHIIATEFDIPLQILSRPSKSLTRQQRIAQNRNLITIDQNRSLHIATLLKSILPQYLDGQLKTEFSMLTAVDIENRLNSKSPLVDLTLVDSNDQKEVKLLTWNSDKVKETRIIYKDFKTNAFIDKLKKLSKRNANSYLKKEKDKLQIKNADSLWTTKQLFYFGTSMFYEREFLTVYEPQENVTDLTSLFEKERGNLYGINGSANFYISSKTDWYAHGKISGGLSRVSNFSDFTLTKFIRSTGSTTSLDGSTLEQQTDQSGYLSNGNPYKFTLSKTAAFDMYAGYKLIGIYGRIGVREDNFANRSTRLPFQAGLVFNFKGNEKDIVSLLLLIDRQNLKLHPNGDTNLGFRVGLPFNLKGESKR